MKQLMNVNYYFRPVFLIIAHQAITVYNETPHESLENAIPNDVYAGRKDVVLAKRREKKRLTLGRRKQYNLLTTMIWNGAEVQVKL